MQSIYYIYVALANLWCDNDILRQLGLRDVRKYDVYNNVIMSV